MLLSTTLGLSNVEIYLKKGYPLILVYRIGSLGKVQFVLAPINDEDCFDNKEDLDVFDDDDEQEQEQKMI